MIDDILKAAGIKYRRSRFPSPPVETYAVFFENIEVDSADPVIPDSSGGLPRVLTHSVTVELYEPGPDDDTEQAIESALNAVGLSWTKQDREWLQDVQRYQVIYEFDFLTKQGG